MMARLLPTPTMGVVVVCKLNGVMVLVFVMVVVEVVVVSDVAFVRDVIVVGGDRT